MTHTAIQARVPALREVIDPAAGILRVTTGFGSTTGPVFGRVGTMHFSDPARNQLWRYTIPRWKVGADEGQLSLHRENEGGVRGMTLDNRGRLLRCEAARGRITREEVDGSVSVLADRRDVTGLRSPDEVVYSVDGSIYFTDLPAVDPTRANRESSAVYQLPRFGNARVVTTECRRPGGLALTARQLHLYVADQAAREIRVFAIQADGALAEGRVFARFDQDGDGIPAGLKTDEAGNLYAAGPGGLWIFNPDGLHLGTVTLPEQPTNCCWGRSFSGLYITAGMSIYFIATKIRGTKTF